MKQLSSALQAVPGVAPVWDWIFGNWQERYWKDRKHFRYYREVVRLANHWAPRANTVLDVGSGNVPLILELDWISSKTNLDLNRTGNLPGCTNLKADFMAYTPPEPFDLVLCLQVLEHLEQPEPFAEKLLRTGKTVILSVPYRWPRGGWESHVHDPIDEHKLRGWTKKDWIDQAVVREASGAERLIIVLEGNPPQSG